MKKETKINTETKVVKAVPERRLDTNPVRNKSKRENRQNKTKKTYKLKRILMVITDVEEKKLQHNS